MDLPFFLFFRYEKWEMVVYKAIHLSITNRSVSGNQGTSSAPKPRSTSLARWGFQSSISFALLLPLRNQIISEQFCSRTHVELGSGFELVRGACHDPNDVCLTSHRYSSRYPEQDKAFTPAQPYKLNASLEISAAGTPMGVVPRRSP